MENQRFPVFIPNTPILCGVNLSVQRSFRLDGTVNRARNASVGGGGGGVCQQGSRGLSFGTSRTASNAQQIAQYLPLTVVWL